MFKPLCVVSPVAEPDDSRHIARAMSLHEFFTFASEAEIVGVWGLAMLIVAALSLLGERRRMKRARIDGAGWVPWTNLFMVSAIIGMRLLALAVKGILAG